MSNAKTLKIETKVDIFEEGGDEDESKNKFDEEGVTLAPPEASAGKNF